MLLLDGQSQREKNFSLGGQSALLTFFDAVERQRRNPCQTGKLCLAQHFGFAHLPDVVPIIHDADPSGVPLEVRNKMTIL